MADNLRIDDDDRRSPFYSKLAEAELKSLKLLTDVLEAYDEHSAEDFSDVIDVVVANRFSQSELAAEFKVSPGTISRWRDGKSCPPSYARRVIVDRLREMLVASPRLRPRLVHRAA